MISKLKIKWVYILTIIFIIVNSFLITQEFYFFNILPFVILIVLFAVFSLQKLVFIIVFLTPLSIPLRDLVKDLEFDMFLPTEPLLFGVLILFTLKLLVEKKFDKKVFYHPISIAIYVNLIWIFMTSLTSTMPLVSFKFLVTRLWFLAAFYFIATQIFKNIENIKKYVWLYTIPLLMVITYAITRHLEYGLIDQKASNSVMTPFYNDHTSYGAILAFYIPILIGFAFSETYSKNFKTIIWIVVSILIFATVLSYTRAAWISLIGVLGVFIAVKLKIKFRTVLIMIASILILFFAFQKQILMSLEENTQDSTADLSKHVQSISNISTDASNLERINRWKCAFRMFEKKPFFGWGPGTYQFQYAPFQLSSEKTIISTNYGNMGNAHSEYIGPLAESGIFGSLTFLAIVITTLYTGLMIRRKTLNKEVRLLSLIFTLGLITYYLHGFLNNFLDTDKASVPFWGFTAILVALDVYHTDKKENEKEVTAQK